MLTPGPLPPKLLRFLVLCPFHYAPVSSVGSVLVEDLPVILVIPVMANSRRMTPTQKRKSALRPGQHPELGPGHSRDWMRHSIAPEKLGNPRGRRCCSGL